MGRPSGTGKRTAHVGFFHELVAQDPDITLFELREALADAEGVTVHHSAIACIDAAAQHSLSCHSPILQHLAGVLFAKTSTDQGSNCGDRKASMSQRGDQNHPSADGVRVATCVMDAR